MHVGFHLLSCKYANPGLFFSLPLPGVCVPQRALITGALCLSVRRCCAVCCRLAVKHGVPWSARLFSSEQSLLYRTRCSTTLFVCF